MALIKCKECGNQVSNKAGKCPHCGVKIPRHISATRFFGALTFVGIGIFIAAINSEKTTVPKVKPVIPEMKTTALETENATPNEIDKIVWIKEIEGYCNDYKSAANEIRASAIFNNLAENFNSNKKRAVNGAMGILERISTNHGGDEVVLSVKIGGYNFDDDSKKGTKIYNQVTNLLEGQCVIFSGEFFPYGFTEKGQVCTDTFIGTLSSIEPCLLNTEQPSERMTETNETSSVAVPNELDEANNRINVVWNGTTKAIRKALLPEQKMWLKQRESDCSAQDDKIHCMAVMTDQRTEELKQKIASMNKTQQAATASKDISLGRCHMETCSWSKNLDKKVISSDNRGKLLQLTILGGVSDFNNEDTVISADPSKITWNKSPHQVYIFCSTKLPAVIMLLDSEGKYQVDVFDFWDGVLGVLEGVAVLYKENCHPSESGLSDEALAKKYNYIQSPNTDISISKPTDILNFVTTAE